MQREDFPMLSDGLIYFDNGATTFKPTTVIKKMSEYYEKYSANAHRGDYKIAYQTDIELDKARENVRTFINAELTEEIIWTSGTTESINLVANGFFSKILKKGDEIIISKSEHASNVLPWFRLAKLIGCEIRYAPLDENYKLSLESIKKSITPNTKVISLAHITNVIGDIRPIKEICAYAHSLGIFVNVDAAQSLPHLPIDVQDLDVDFLSFSAHKMIGPTGVGVLYGRKKLLEHIEPLNLGGGMNESFDNEFQVNLKSLPERLEAGTVNIAGIIGMGEAVEYLKKIGMEKIRNYELKLAEYLVSKLEQIPHIEIINQKSETGIIAFNVQDVFSQDVAYYLDKYNICVRAGSHCAKILKKETGVANTVRISLYFYNTYEEIDELIKALESKEKIIKEMI